ncbi:hypothetical protein ABB05_21155 [Lederbergia galactosidilytica]|uniref:Uncharacterized protein n=1 Tax=Lederbergia galactosidilytica TaxID=217031 RepID=A0A0Q9Y021_9BACI|nr:hypothetical protein ACA29_22840 [Lederbergia galactosidilytica]OAK67618.1 hypothetical protein ABB05_21155 [Lederbergia galactosidilytica]
MLVSVLSVEVFTWQWELSTKLWVLILEYGLLLWVMGILARVWASYKGNGVFGPRMGLLP